MGVYTLHGSGGHLTADLTDEQAKKADLGVGKLFLAPIGRLDPERITAYFCKTCGENFQDPPEMRLQDSGEEVADNLVLVEHGQYACTKCGKAIGEYRIFRKHDVGADAGMARQNG